MREAQPPREAVYLILDTDDHPEPKRIEETVRARDGLLIDDRRKRRADRLLEETGGEFEKRLKDEPVDSFDNPSRTPPVEQHPTGPHQKRTQPTDIDWPGTPSEVTTSPRERTPATAIATRGPTGYRSTTKAGQLLKHDEDRHRLATTVDDEPQLTTADNTSRDDADQPG